MTKRLFNRIVIGLGMNHLEIGGSLFLNKGFELNFYFEKEYWDWFRLSLVWDRKVDHAGISLNISLPFFSMEAKVYDSRHWNHDSNRWYLPGEETREFSDVQE